MYNILKVLASGFIKRNLRKQQQVEAQNRNPLNFLSKCVSLSSIFNKLEKLDMQIKSSFTKNKSQNVSINPNHSKSHQPNVSKVLGINSEKNWHQGELSNPQKSERTDYRIIKGVKIYGRLPVIQRAITKQIQQIKNKEGYKPIQSKTKILKIFLTDEPQQIAILQQTPTEEEVSNIPQQDKQQNHQTQSAFINPMECQAIAQQPKMNMPITKPENSNITYQTPKKQQNFTVQIQSNSQSHLNPFLSASRQSISLKDIVSSTFNYGINTHFAPIQNQTLSYLCQSYGNNIFGDLANQQLPPLTSPPSNYTSSQTYSRNPERQSSKGLNKKAKPKERIHE